MVNGYCHIRLNRYCDLNRLIGILDNGSMVQYSVFMTKRRRGAIAAVKLAEHYGAEVMVFKGEKKDFF